MISIMMENLKLTQTALVEFRIDTPKDFCLNSLDNSVILSSNGSDFYMWDLLYHCDMLINTPLYIRQGKIQLDKPIANLVKYVDYTAIYDNSSVLECQELALDHIYITECSIKPPKPRLIKADFLPGTQMCCFLTSYGAFELMQQDCITLEWKFLNTKLNQLLIGEIFPLNISPSDIKTFNQLRNYVNTYYITSFACVANNLLYLGMAGGCVVALKFRETNNEYNLLDTLQTTVERITYMKAEKNFIFIGCAQGQVCILKFDEENKKLKQMDFLWSKKDRMVCRCVTTTYDNVTQTYVVVLCKAGNLFAYRLNTEGSIMANATVHVKGIKITGLVSLSNMEFIITTIDGYIHLATVTFPAPDALKITMQAIKHGLDSNNFQFLGVTCSKSRNIWYFLLYRNKDYLNQSKYRSTSAFVAICKSSAHDSLAILSKTDVDIMNNAQDLLLSINMDININCDIERYTQFMALNQLKCPAGLDEEFVQQLQKKYIIIRQITAYQTLKIKYVKSLIEIEKKFLETVLQIFHILKSLQYLQSFVLKRNKLSAFQELSVFCMQASFLHLLTKLTTNDDISNENPFQPIFEDFSKMLSIIYENCKFDITNFQQIITEKCEMCDEELNANIHFYKCPQEHEIKRCMVSCVQLPLFSRQYCPNCKARVANEDDAFDLLQLLGCNEVMKCVFCRYMLKDDIC